MPTYRRADAETLATIEELIDEYHGVLKDCAVRVGALFAFAPRDEETGEPKNPAIKKYGLPAVATVRIVSQRDRVSGLADAMVVLDGDAWRGWSDAHQRAVIDRQLQHIEVQIDDDGNVKTDDCNRPKLRIVPPDYLISGFRLIAERYGDDSLERQEARMALKVYGESVFGLMAQ